MFNDERERGMVARDPYAQSIQSWAAWMDEQAQTHPQLLPTRVLRSIGSRLIRLGSTLNAHFGGAHDPRVFG